MSKDQAIGGAILAVCVIVAIGYVILMIDPGPIISNANNVRLYATTVLVSIAFIAILAIGAWIGWTMATTPPPKPIEEITTEMEEKKEEVPPPPTEESAPPASEAPAQKKKS
jgi:hypothetical protein